MKGNQNFSQKYASRESRYTQITITITLERGILKLRIVSRDARMGMKTG